MSDRDDPSDTPDPPNKEDTGNVLVFPGGKTVNTKDLGAAFVVSGSGPVPTAELLDPADAKRDLQDRISFVKKQPLVKAMAEDALSAITALCIEIAEELAHLKYERRKASADGKNTASLTVLRINGLKSLADTLLRRKETLVAEQLDLKSPRLQKIFKIWMGFFYESMQKSGISDEVINVVFQQMKADMQGWESKLSDS